MAYRYALYLPDIHSIGSHANEVLYQGKWRRLYAERTKSRTTRPFVKISGKKIYLKLRGVR